MNATGSGYVSSIAAANASLILIDQLVRWMSGLPTAVVPDQRQGVELCKPAPEAEYQGATANPAARFSRCAGPATPHAADGALYVSRPLLSA